MKLLRSSFKQNQGFTLTEAIIVVAIVGILAAIAVPSYQDMLERNRLKQAAESLADDLKFARTEAIKRSNDSTLTLTISGSTWSYTISNGGTLKSVQGSDFIGTSLDAATSVVFSFRRGTPTTTRRPILSSDNYQTALDVCKSGKILICTPDGVTGLPGYPTCFETAGECQPD